MNTHATQSEGRNHKYFMVQYCIICIMYIFTNTCKVT